MVQPFGRIFWTFLIKLTCIYPMALRFHSWVFIRRNENICSCKEWSTNVHHSLAHRNPVSTCRLKENLPPWQRAGKDQERNCHSSLVIKKGLIAKLTSTCWVLQSEVAILHITSLVSNNYIQQGRVDRVRVCN